MTGSNALISGGSTLTINNGVTVQTGVTGTETISAPVALGGSQTWLVTDAASTLDDQGGVNFGANTWTKGGAGTLVLGGADTGTGAIVVSDGVLNIQNNGSLGNASSVTVSSGAALQMQGGISTTAAVALTLNGSGISNAGALEGFSGVDTYSGPDYSWFQHDHWRGCRSGSQPDQYRDHHRQRDESDAYRRGHRQSCQHYRDGHGRIDEVGHRDMDAHRSEYIYRRDRHQRWHPGPRYGRQPGFQRRG